MDEERGALEAVVALTRGLALLTRCLLLLRTSSSDSRALFLALRSLFDALYFAFSSASTTYSLSFFFKIFLCDTRKLSASSSRVSILACKMFLSLFTSFN